MQNALTATNLSKSYGTKRALLACSLRIPDHSVYCLVGSEGAGKTTLFRILCGLQRPTTGAYTLYGVHSGTPAIRSARRRLGAVIGEPAIIGDLSASDNLRASSRLRGIRDEQLVRETLRLVGLSTAGDKKARSFPRALRQRLGIGCALLSSPDLIILDEPARGLGQQEMADLKGLVARLNDDRGITFLISGQSASDLSGTATWYGFLAGGQMEQEISAAELNSRSGGYVTLEVCEAARAAAVLHRLQLPCQVETETRLSVLDPPPAPALVRMLHEQGIAVRHLQRPAAVGGTVSVPIGGRR